MMRESLEAIAQGKDPLCIIRDPAQQKIDFPQKSTMMEKKQQDVGYALGMSKDLQDSLV